MRGFITPVGKGNTTIYEIPDYQNTGIKAIEKCAGYSADVSVTVVYDNTGADLYSADGRFILTCPVVQRAKNAQIEKTDKHKEAESHLMQRKNAMLKSAMEFERGVRRADEVLDTQLGYEAEVHLGGDKNTVNAAYEEEIDAMVAEVPVQTTKRAVKKDAPQHVDMKKRALEQLIFGNS